MSAIRPNDSAPLSLGEEFAAPAVPRTSVLQESAPATLAQSFDPKAIAWSKQFWGVGVWAFSQPTAPIVLALTGVSGASAVGTSVADDGTGTSHGTATLSAAAPTAVSSGIRVYTYSALIGSVTVESGADVSADLSGVDATGAVGTIALALSCGTVGEAAASSVGQLVSADAIELSGASIEAVDGTVVGSLDAELSGSEQTGELGDVTANLALAVAGQDAAGSLSAPAVELECAVAGEEATSDVGDLVADVGTSESLTGLEATSAIDTIAAELESSLIGEENSSETGSLGTGIALSGLESATDLGAVFAQDAAALSGLESQSAVGDASVLLTSIEGDGSLEAPAARFIGQGLGAPAQQIIGVVGGRLRRPRRRVQPRAEPQPVTGHAAVVAHAATILAGGLVQSKPVAGRGAVIVGPQALAGQGGLQITAVAHLNGLDAAVSAAGMVRAVTRLPVEPRQRSLNGAGSMQANPCHVNAVGIEVDTRAIDQAWTALQREHDSDDDVARLVLGVYE